MTARLMTVATQDYGENMAALFGKMLVIAPLHSDSLLSRRILKWFTADRRFLNRKDKTKGPIFSIRSCIFIMVTCAWVHDQGGHLRISMDC